MARIDGCRAQVTPSHDFQMRIFIDESGIFIPPTKRHHSFSLVLAVITPSAAEANPLSEFRSLRDSWPKQSGEIKGSSLDEPQAAQLIDLISRYDALVNFKALDMAMHPPTVIDEIKRHQADAVTAHLTGEHRPALASQLIALEKSVRSMPNQLFLQAFLMINLILEALEEGTLYYVQREPEELGEISWTIDRKDHSPTEMEKTWTTLILPICENHFAIHPLKTLEGADYSHFEARYGFKAEAADDEWKKHFHWLEETYGFRPSDGEIVIQARPILTERFEFLDSRDSLGLQLADMLAAILRRALNGNLQLGGWKDFGKLLLRKSQPGSSFVQFGKSVNGAPRPIDGQPGEVCRILFEKSRSLFPNGGQ